MSSQRNEFMLRDLECEENGHPLQKRILQTVHYAPGTNQIVAIKIPKEVLDDVRCPVQGCNSRPKDPNE